MQANSRVPTSGLLDLSGRVAVVTGAASGIGREIALGFARHGAALTLIDIDGDGLTATREEIVALGGAARACIGDVTSEAQVKECVAAAVSAFGTVDILVNSAGASIHVKPEDVLLTDWERVIKLNLTGYFLVAREVGAVMIARRGPGTIVNVSSIAGSTALGRGNFAYSVAKAGINQLTRELAVEWAPHEIRVNALQPCQVLTPALERLIANPTFEGRDLIDRFLNGIPLNRLATAADMVGPALFLVSDASLMVTGVLLPVDGGNLALNAGGGDPPRVPEALHA